MCLLNYHCALLPICLLFLHFIVYPTSSWLSENYCPPELIHIGLLIFYETFDFVNSLFSAYLNSILSFTVCQVSIESVTMYHWQWNKMNLYCLNFLFLYNYFHCFMAYVYFLFLGLFAKKLSWLRIFYILLEALFSVVSTSMLPFYVLLALFFQLAITLCQGSFLGYEVALRRLFL